MKITITTKKLDELISMFESLPEEVLGDCLSEKELADYSKDNVPQTEVKRFDRHLASCVECLDKVQHLVQASQVLEEKGGKKKPLTRLSERLLDKELSDLQQINKSWRSFVESGEELAWAASTYEELSRKVWESSKGPLTVCALVDRDSDLTFLVTSEELLLEGTRIYINVGTWRREVILRRVSETQVGAKVLIPARDRPSNLADISWGEMEEGV